jgi:hypothetical protein
VTGTRGGATAPKGLMLPSLDSAAGAAATGSAGTPPPGCLLTCWCGCARLPPFARSALSLAALTPWTERSDELAVVATALGPPHQLNPLALAPVPRAEVARTGKIKFGLLLSASARAVYAPSGSLTLYL